jgi:hypothetical protein
MTLTNAELLGRLRLMRGVVGATLQVDELDALMAELDDRHCAMCRWARSGRPAADGALVQGDPPSDLECSMISEDEFGQAIPLAHLEGDLRGEAWLSMAPEFGCVMWEARDSAPCAHGGIVDFPSPAWGRCKKCGAWIPGEAKP